MDPVVGYVSFSTTLGLDISNNVDDGAFEQIGGWMERTGGLWMIE
jgi:hypothetical protein